MGGATEVKRWSSQGDQPFTFCLERAGTYLLLSLTDEGDAFIWLNVQVFENGLAYGVPEVSVFWAVPRVAGPRVDRGHENGVKDRGGKTNPQIS